MGGAARSRLRLRRRRSPVGTVTSEPGSGGDIAKTRSTAVLDGDTWRVSGDKHFGSGTGIADRMITTAVPEGEDRPTVFVLDTTTDEGRTSSASGTGWACGPPRATPSASTAHPPSAWRPSGRWSRSAGRPCRSSRRSSWPSSSACSTRPSPPPGPRSGQGRRAAGLRAGRVGQGRAGPLAGGPGPRGRAAGPRVRRPRRRRPRRAPGQAVHRRAGRADPAPPQPGPRRRDVLAALPVQPLAGGRPGPRLPPPARGAWPTTSSSTPRSDQLPDRTGLHYTGSGADDRYIHEANPCRALARAAAEGDRIAEAGGSLSMAKLVPYVETLEPRQFGRLKGKIWIAHDFDETPQWLISAFKDDICSTPTSPSGCSATA